MDPFAWDDDEDERATRPRDWVAAAVMTLAVALALLAGVAFTVQWFLTNLYNVGE